MSSITLAFANVTGTCKGPIVTVSAGEKCGPYTHRQQRHIHTANNTVSHGAMAGACACHRGARDTSTRNGTERQRQRAALGRCTSRHEIAKILSCVCAT
jgi:hypothetical protein